MQKTGGGAFGIPPIAVSNADSTDIQLAGNAVGTILQPLIQHIKPLIGQWLAVGNAAPGRINAVNGMENRPDRRLGRSAQTDQLRVRGKGAHSFRQRQRNPVAAQQC